MGRKRRLGESIQDLSGRSGQRVRHDRCNHRQSPPAQRRGSKKGGFERSDRPLARRIDDQDSRHRRCAGQSAGGEPHWRTRSRRNAGPSLETQEIEPAALLADKGYCSDGFIEHLLSPQHQARHSAEGKSQDAARVGLRALLRAQPRGTFLQQHQALSRHRNPLRKDRQKFPRRRPPRLRLGLAHFVLSAGLVIAGAEPAQHGPRTFGEYARWLERLLNAVGIQSAWVVGNSFGAAVAWQFASQFSTRSLGLVLVNGGPAPNLPAPVRRLFAMTPMRQLITAVFRWNAYSRSSLKRAFADPS